MNLLLLLSALVIAACTDARKMEIPIPLFPACSLICGVIMVLQSNSISILGYAFAGALFLSIFFIIGAFFGVCGGGDILMFACTGFVLRLWQASVYAICLAVTSTASMLIYLVVQCRRHKKIRDTLKGHIPVAPIALLSYIVFLILEYA